MFIYYKPPFNSDVLYIQFLLAPKFCRILYIKVVEMRKMGEPRFILTYILKDILNLKK